MNSLNLATILLVAYLAVFADCRLTLVRNTLGAQIDLLPPLLAYAGLTASLPAIATVAVLGGLWLDSLSANPFGVSVIPLAAAGFAAHAFRGILLRRDPSIQYLAGLGAAAGVPLLTLALLALAGETPLSGGWFAWRWIAGAALSAAFTPLFFALFERVQRLFSYQPEPSVSFRPDREIDRGRDSHAHH
jgi:rod shape-determining protein MreD